MKLYLSVLGINAPTDLNMIGLKCVTIVLWIVEVEVVEVEVILFYHFEMKYKTK